MDVFMRSQKLIVTICLLLILTPASTVAAQSDSWEEVFASVPEQLRVGLVERFRLLAEYERTERWGELYDLLIKPLDQSKESFVEQRRKDSSSRPERWLVEFVPTKVDKEQIEVTKADYRITGYAKVRAGGCVVKRGGTVYAFLRDGEWYFSGYLIELTPSHTPLPPCLGEDKP